MGMQNMPPHGQPGPFGWTGVKTERYTRWTGRLGSKRRIVLRMMIESIKHELKSPAVIILVALSWVFSVLFTVMSAGFGGVVLEREPGDTSGFGGYIPSVPEGIEVSQHSFITNDTTASYELMGLETTRETMFGLMGIPSGWNAFVNESRGGPPVLLVTPPEDAEPPANASILVSAITGSRTDYFMTFTQVDPFMASFDIGMRVDLESQKIEGKADEKVSAVFTIENTGNMADSYNVTLKDKPGEWKMRAYVDGVETDVKTVTRTEGGGHGPGNGPWVTTKHKVFKVSVEAGDTALCRIEFRTADDSIKTNPVSIAVQSQTDPFVYGKYPVTIELKDLKKVDLTGSVVWYQIMSIQVLWALFLAAVVGSKMIASDVAQKSYNLYFARPMTKTDYVVGKFGILATLLGLITLLPTVVAYSLLLLLVEVSTTYVVEHLWVWGSILAWSLVVIITMTTMSLAFSSMTSRRFYAAAAVVVIFLATAIISQIITFGFGIEYGPLISIGDNFDIIGRTLFKLGDGLDLEFPWYYSILTLVPIWIVCTLMVWLKIERTELSE